MFCLRKVSKHCSFEKRFFSKSRPISDLLLAWVTCYSALFKAKTNQQFTCATPNPPQRSFTPASSLSESKNFLCFQKLAKRASSLGGLRVTEIGFDALLLSQDFHKTLPICNTELHSLTCSKRPSSNYIVSHTVHIVCTQAKMVTRTFTLDHHRICFSGFDNRSEGMFIFLSFTLESFQVALFNL